MSLSLSNANALVHTYLSVFLRCSLKCISARMPGHSAQKIRLDVPMCVYTNDKKKRMLFSKRKQKYIFDRKKKLFKERKQKRGKKNHSKEKKKKQ